MSTWSSNFNHNFGFVVEEIFELKHNRKSRCFDTKKNRTLTLLSTLKDKFLQKLKLESCQSIQCEAILKDVVLLPCTNSLSFGILYLKKPRLRGTVAQELNRQSKIHEQSIHSTATKTIIETFLEYFSISIYSRKHQARFYSVNVLVLHKLCSQKFFTRIRISTNCPVLL